MTEYPMRRHTAGGFVHLPNAAVNDERLSFKARGILAYLLGRPPGWRFAADRIARVSPKEGREAVLSGLKELTEAGYYRWTRVRLGDGTFVVVTEVTDDPAAMPAPPTSLDGFLTPESANPVPAEPASADPAPADPPPMSGQSSHDRETDTPPASQGAPAAAQPKRKPTRTRVDEGFTPSAMTLAWAAERWPGVDVAAEVEGFVLYHQSRGTLMADWQKAMQTWVRNAGQRVASTRPLPNRHTVDATSDEYAVYREAFEQ